MPKIYLVVASLFGGLAVAGGAFAAHGLKKITADEKIIGSFQTAVQYQMYHALALLAIAALYNRRPSSLLKWAANCFIIGVIFFSGSLYLLVFLKLQGNSAGLVGPVTPFGGIFFLSGWILLLFSFTRGDRNRKNNLTP